ncbi:MAG: tetracycline regulation of excision, RteC [Flavobacterium sp.]|uniref:RteC domain-containing protein n=1 Tax=Flavobacterium sp. TaxID=239 RepID=UPI0025C1C0FF|nr:RteC domain-containing protein [Flavobacterium sp.]MBA4133391.1 tetracycline regulation of excision, RteC [Flavobacterium sp.]
MENYCKEIIENLEEEIKTLTTGTDCSLFFYEKGIDLIIQKIAKLRELVQAKGFKNTLDEIQFFKVQKPLVISRLIYFNAVYKIEAKRPHIGKRLLEAYFNNEMLEINRFYDKNIEFYRYCRTNSTHLDHKYFVRGESDIKLGLDSYYFEVDHSFSTSHDYKVAKIIANDLIQLYIEQQLSSIADSEAISKLDSNKSVLTWTANKTDLIELIYALHTNAVFNNKNLDIKSIATCFEQIFSIELGDFYHTFLELRNRKKNPTKFLDLLREGLINKMEEQDEK